MKKEDIDKILQEANDALGKLTDKQIQQYISEGHKKQNSERASKGGSTKSVKKTKHLKKLAKTHSPIQGKKNVESGLLKSICSDGGKAGTKVQMEKGIGIHTDKETRREWSRLGGLVVIDSLNKEKICPHCKIVSRGAGYNRWHGDNCKHKK